VTARDRWCQAPATLDLLLARTDPRHPVVVVDAKAPRRVRAVLDQVATSGRVRVCRGNRQMAGNEARNLGSEAARTEWIAFVENDTIPSEGWLETLLAEGEARDAASVYPAFLQPGPTGPVVHGLGADLDMAGSPGALRVRERQHRVGQPWRHVAPGLEPVERLQSEFHVLAVRRELLERLGGLDEGLLSWFDHTDLALHHRRLGAAAWFVPAVTCLYLMPPPVSPKDLHSFLLRWGRAWWERSLAHLCAVWGFDRHDDEWDVHARYRARIRSAAPTPWRHVNLALDYAAAPLERAVTSLRHASA
jgi:hypothetical protein